MATKRATIQQVFQNLVGRSGSMLPMSKSMRGLASLSATGSAGSAMTSRSGLDGLHDLFDDLILRQVSGIHQDRIARDRQRPDRSRRIAVIAGHYLVEHVVVVHDLPARPQLRHAPPRALLRRGIEVELEVGIGKDDRSLVSPLRDDVRVL